MNMKKYTASAKGFTLVELIVVIVILAILATIAFLSFSSQSSAARDSKRATDLSSIASKINVAQAQGTAVLSMVDDSTDKSLANWYIIAGFGWADLKTAWAYKAGKINYTALGIKGEDFKDPSGNEYPIGATSKCWQVFHLAAKVENDKDWNPSETGSILNGNYAPRDITAAWKTIAIDSWIASVEGVVVWYFRVWDKINVWPDEAWLDSETTTCYIKSISSDKTKLTLVTALTGWSACWAATDVVARIAIWTTGATTEAHALIEWKDWTTPVTDWVNAPY